MSLELEREIYFTQQISYESLKIFHLELKTLLQADCKKSINLLLTCPGGSCNAGFAMYDLITSLYKSSLRTYALGHVGSMAVPVYLTGKKRFIGKHAKMFLHELGKDFAEDPGRKKASDIKKLSAIQDRFTDQYCHIVSGATNKKLSKKDVYKMMISDTTLTPKEALKWGLAHQII